MTAELEKQASPRDDAAFAGKVKKIRERQQQIVDAHKASLKRWVDQSTDFLSERDKVMAMLEYAFEDYLKLYPDDEALELIQLHWTYVLKRRSTVQ